MNNINEFLLKNPSVPEVLEFIDSEAKRIASKRLQSSDSPHSSMTGGE